MHLKIPQD